MDIIILILKISFGLFILRIGYRSFKRRKGNKIIQNAENKIHDFKDVSILQLTNYFDYLSEQIQMYPNIPKLNFFRAIVAARLSTLVDDKEIVKKYYTNSSYDLKIWTGIPSSSGGAVTPAMDTQYVSNLRRAGNRNRDFMDHWDTIGEMGNGKSFDEAMSQQLNAMSVRDKNIQND